MIKFKIYFYIKMDNKTNYKKYTIKQKLHILNLLHNYSISKCKIERLYGISRKTQRDWAEQEEDLMDALHKNKKYRINGGGKKPEIADLEFELCQYVDTARGLGISIITNEIIVKAMQLMPTLNNKSYSTLYKWCYKFLRRNNYTLRRKTHIGQGPKKESFDQLMNFLKTIINIRKELQILENLKCIGNADETPIFFEMYNNYTVSKIGEKTGKVKNFGYEKDRV